MHIQNRFKRIELAIKFSGYEHTDTLLKDLQKIYINYRKTNQEQFNEIDPNLFPLDYFTKKGS